DLLRSSESEFMICKNAGGPRVAKLDAAAALGLPVIMIRRPFKPVVATVTTIAELLGTLGLAV
ncbi:MAG: precorrin-6A/cobalt-precorrin-6A reductase, partial [Aestuariivirga sp.]